MLMSKEELKLVIQFFDAFGGGLTWGSALFNSHQTIIDLWDSIPTFLLLILSCKKSFYLSNFLLFGLFLKTSNELLF